MRKIFAILTICAIMLLSACQQAELPKSTDPPVQSTASSSYVEESQEAETQETTVSTTASSQPVITETSTTETTVSETTAPTEETKPKQTEPAQTSTEENTTPTERKPKETEPEVTKPAETQSQEITDTGKTDEPVPTDPVIVRADPTDVEQLVAVYLNQHRNAAGASSATVLPGLTTVARYRSVQLISNFAHANSATVCTELQYGQFVDMTQYGMSESDSYYQGYNREALAKGNWGGTAEEVARKIADGLKNSPNHWKYLSSTEYGYMAVSSQWKTSCLLSGLHRKMMKKRTMRTKPPAKMRNMCGIQRGRKMVENSKKYKIGGYVKRAKLNLRNGDDVKAFHRGLLERLLGSFEDGELVDIYIDITGYKETSKRPEMLRLMRDCAVGKVNLVFAETKGYLAANTREFCYWLHFMFNLDSRIDIITDDDQFNINTILNDDQQREALIKMAEDYIYLNPPDHQKWLSGVVSAIANLGEDG